MHTIEGNVVYYGLHQENPSLLKALIHLFKSCRLLKLTEINLVQDFQLFSGIFSKRHNLIK